MEADETIAAYEGRLTDAARAFLPNELRDRLRSLEAAGEGADDDARVALADVLAEAISLAEEREADVRALPDAYPPAPPLDDPWGPVGTDEAAASVAAGVEALARRVDRDADVSRTGARITARFRADGEPIVWSVHLGAELSWKAGGEAEAFGRSSHWMATSVAGDAPLVSVRKEGLSDTVLKALRLRTEAEVDDGRFDDMFFVEGYEAFARALFSGRLRRAFVRRGDGRDFTFRLGGPVASLVWKGNIVSGLLSEAAFTSSIEVLVALRASLRELCLVRRPSP